MSQDGLCVNKDSSTHSWISVGRYSPISAIKRGIDRSFILCSDRGSIQPGYTLRATHDLDEITPPRAISKWIDGFRIWIQRFVCLIPELLNSCYVEQEQLMIVSRRQSRMSENEITRMWYTSSAVTGNKTQTDNPNTTALTAAFENAAWILKPSRLVR